VIARLARWSVAGIAALTIAGCDTADRPDTPELLQIARGVDRLRDAPPEQKRPLLKALSQLPCAEDAGCQLKQLCVRAYEAHLEALDGTAAVRRALDKGDAGPLDQAARLVELSRTRLEQARELTEQCAKLEAELRPDLSVDPR